MAYFLNVLQTPIYEIGIVKSKKAFTMLFGDLIIAMDPIVWNL